MDRTVSFKVTRGMDSAVRVMATLRRKQFGIKEISMKSIDSTNSELKITLEDEKKVGLEKAILQMKKLVDVYDVVEV